MKIRNMSRYFVVFTLLVFLSVTISLFQECNADSPLVIYGFVIADSSRISDFEVSATNERTGDTLSAEKQTGSTGAIYVVTFGGPGHEWIIGDTISLHAEGQGSYASYEGTTSFTIVSDEPKQINIPISLAQPQLHADFSFTPGTPKQGENVTFLDLSTGSVSLYAWDFGDGNESAQQNPIHVYVHPGDYLVTLTISHGTFSTSTSDIISVASSGNTTLDDTDDNGGGIPGFTFSVLLVAMILILVMFIRHKNFNNK